MDIKVSDIKELREKTGAGMMDCKKALAEAEGDVAAAEQLLKEWGLAGVEKRAGRATNEGMVFVKEGPGKVSLVEIVCETDFVVRNKDFQAAGKKLLETAYAKEIAGPDAELEGMVKDIAAVIKENITLKRVRLLKAGANECVHSYVHGDGKIGVAIKLKSDKASAFEGEKVKAFVHDMALHIAAFHPLFLDQSKPDAAWIKEQKDNFQKLVDEDEKMKGKPQKVIDGALAGKFKKLMAEVCLMDQGFVREEKTPVAQAMAAVAKEAGCSLEIADFAYLKIGDD
jgi:elongation factor Ts